MVATTRRRTRAQWEISLASRGRHLAAARARQAAVMDTLRQQAVAAAAEGIPETVIAKLCGVDRMTLRGWLGKDQRRK